MNMVMDISSRLQALINAISIRMICNKFGKSTQAFYKERKERGKKAVEETTIINLVREERLVNPRIGCKKLYKVLSVKFEKAGISIGINSFFRLLKNYGLLIEKRPTKTCRTTKQDPSQIPAMNLVKHMIINGPYQAYCCDITYVRVGACFIYLALVTDMFTRCILGYAVSASIDSALVIEALEMAAKKTPKKFHPVAHSDRGCQYGSKAYRQVLKGLNWEQSMTEILHCYENGMAERVNGILKGEYFLDTRFRNVKEAVEAVEQAIDRYNNRRLHTSLNYKTPMAFLKECMEAAAA